MIRWIVMLAWIACGPALAASADARLDARAAALSHELRCLVCQNQTIADSQAGLAVDLRRQVREKLAQGMSEREVVDFVVARYGDFVLYRPPVKRSTWLLWFGPFVLLAGGALAFRAWMARRTVPSALAPDERERAARMLDQETEAP